jgi:preprotein translocase subunit SecB
MADIPETDAAANGDEQNRQFALQKIYIKDISFETPHSPEIFAEEWAPAVNMQLSSETTLISEEIEELHEVVLTVTVTVSIGEKTAYLIEVQQAGIFHIKGFPDKMMTHMVSAICPNMLFPFAREVVSDLITRGGFPQLLLAPVNFEALYAQQQQQTAIDESESKDATDIRH